MPQITNDGVAIHYEVEGDGPPLVMHHGFSGTLQHWREYGYVDALRDRYRCVLIDARGHGQSDKPHDPALYANAIRAQDVLLVLDQLGIDRTLYCGFSMGGNVAYGIMTTHPQRLRAAVVLAADPSPYDTDIWNHDIDLMQQGMETYLANLESQRGRYPDAQRAQILANDAQALVASKTETRDWPGVAQAFAAVTVPTLLIDGDQDPMVGLVRRAADSNPHAEFVSLPGLNHIDTLRRSDLTLPLLETFLARVASAASTT